MLGVRGRIALLALVASVLAGCGRSGAGLHPVEGQVLFNGQPVEGAKVVLQPKGEVDPLASNPSGSTGADGKFKLSTYPSGDGAKPGEYVACVLIPPGAEARLAGAPLKNLPNRYVSRDTSGLAVIVKEGRNQLEPFQLQK